MVPSDPHIVCQIDFANAFQAPSRQLSTNDCILGKVSRTYDNGNVQIGDELPHLVSLNPFFPYFRSMNDVSSRNRFIDHEGSIHYIEGTKGGQQGDPLEMLRFCLTVLPIWGRILNRHSQTIGAAYADDAYLMGQIEPTLRALADTVSSFRQDADLKVSLPKCTIYMQGIPEEQARQLIHDCLVENVSGTLAPLLPMLAPASCNPGKWPLRCMHPHGHC